MCKPSNAGLVKRLFWLLVHDPYAHCRWELMEAAGGILQPDGTSYLNGQTVVQHLFTQASADNIAVIRAFGQGATGNFVLQPSPGETALVFLCAPVT